MRQEDLELWKDYQLSSIDAEIQDDKISTLMVLCEQVGIVEALLFLDEATCMFRDAGVYHAQWDAVSQVLLTAASEVHRILKGK